jgi:hypothetical protein
MDAIHKFADQMIDFAERVSDVADAASGKGPRSSRRGVRWVLLPAAGAALYALLRSDSFARQAKGVADEAKTRAADLPSELMNAVRQTSDETASGNGARARSQRSSRAASSAKRSSTRNSSTGSRRSTQSRKSKSGR